MSVTKEELGRRLKVARENAQLTQAEVADRVELSRGAVGQFEIGLKAPNTMQLVAMARMYSRDPEDFLQTEFAEDQRDALAAIFRAEPSMANDGARRRAVEACAALLKEQTNLESLLGIDRKRLYPPKYEGLAPQNRWEAIQEGERLADLERARLKLGEVPIKEMAAILEPQGLRLAEMQLDNDISGMCLNDSRHGLAIIVNAGHHPRRKAFSYAHEYCHVVADRDRASIVSRMGDRDHLVEIRANAFSAAFLMPAAGVRAFARGLGKGEQSRSVLRSFDEPRHPSEAVQVVEAQKREDARSQDIQLYDVVHLAHHFCVSYEAALYRLWNLRLISEEEHTRFAAQRELANAIRRGLALEEKTDEAPARHEFRHQVLGLAMEAYRREVISRAKLRELCLLADMPADEIEPFLAAVDDTLDDTKATVPSPHAVAEH